MRKLLIFFKVTNADAKFIAQVIHQKGEGFEECLIAICIDEREAEYAEKKIVNMGWVGEKVGAELMGIIIKMFRQEAYDRAAEIEHLLSSHPARIRIIIENGYEEELLARLIKRENPDAVVWVKRKEGWLQRLLKRKPSLPSELHEKIQVIFFNDKILSKERKP